MKTIQGGVTAPKGFKATGLNAGIKNHTKKDMAMIYSEKPCTVGGTFTTNKVKAAPVKWDQKVVYETKTARNHRRNPFFGYFCAFLCFVSVAGTGRFVPGFAVFFSGDSSCSN